MTIYYIEQKRDKRNTAGSKAPEDICLLCAQRGYTKFAIERFPVEYGNIRKKIWRLTVCNNQWKALYKKVQKDDFVIIQHPSYGTRMALKWITRIRKEVGCKFIAVIHDLESLRKGIEGVITNHVKTNQIADNDLLKCFDAVICHNEHMRQYLIAQGFDPEKLVNLEIFDYLSDCKIDQSEKAMSNSIAIAGNLAFGKSSYIYEIYKDGHNYGLTTNLYGNNFEKEKATGGMIYHGSFKPEELPAHLEGDFGLVWDGISVETCAGNTGEYLKYNNPHKTSLYLSAGLPVIVWSQAAIADFVKANGVGIVVDNLYEIENITQKLDYSEYEKMRENVQVISKRLREGWYFKTALDRAINLSREEL